MPYSTTYNDLMSGGGVGLLPLDDFYFIFNLFNDVSSTSIRMI